MLRHISRIHVRYRKRTSRSFHASPLCKKLASSAVGHHDLNEWEINGNIHYLIPFAGRFSVYPLAGIAFQSWRGNALQNDKELSNTRNKFGINAGAGFEMNISRHLNLHIEGKYIFINDFNQANISIGLGYKF